MDYKDHDGDYKDHDIDYKDDDDKLALSMSSGPATTEGFGSACFKGAVADKYLSKYGESSTLLANGKWTKDMAKADIVAKAVLDWAVENGASVYCHWFQPMGSSGVRHGNSGQVHQSMFNFAEDGTPYYSFTGEQLLQGETDGSSFPNGGMRATHTAGGYLSIDPYSPIFLREDTVFIPAAFVSYNGDALDEKTPLHRATDALDKQTKRMLKAMKYDVGSASVYANIGLEQEIFLTPRHAFYRRPDLQFTGRTITGKFPARGQEMSDHYMAPISRATGAFECMRQIQQECFKMGIPLKTRHREVAPNQYEFAPMFGNAISQVDQNLMIMQVIEEVASEHGLAALLQEKPFAGVNGSGKHNNWSIGTSDGLNLMNPKQVNAKTGNPEIFPLVMAAMVSAVDKHGDLMRAAIASPGNDFRLGAMEAPPAVMSTYLGPSLTEFLNTVKNGSLGEYAPKKKPLEFGSDTLPSIEVPAEDRNRTSPFPYGGNRFEFRAAGSSQNVSLVNTVLNTIAAEAFKIVADRLEAGEKPLAIAQDLLKTHDKCIFNGNGYDPAWPDEAVKRGIWRIDAGCDAINELDSAKNVTLFEGMGIFTAREIQARKSVLLGHYVGSVEMEALTMIDMINQHVIPSVKKADLGNPSKLVDAVKTIKGAVAQIHGTEDEHKAATLARTLRLTTMVAIREIIDEFESRCPPEDWTLATYSELLFFDTYPESEYGCGGGGSHHHHHHHHHH
uniref:Glutamine synthetase n=1 Tax=Ostreococcus tauri TaxID=70448 RepID=UPI0023AB56C7|nr:Chain A, Glutamine synthetase [Ostreococcus tauri]7U6O_B Chain B, Glutamine synthetase [Ostreococcus tauri]7U6O_C Chain C, Glutamine synthetase [Ostreococcus tauri]7U6O_D Chain D, Glutamine synthetase [Ostreococcus tauri]7U6O_E Chain E, Glutamine synthetase [Ostreococcus tauri]7U6O_F Chain F, Glutamine synthetase [Ostreococcus tauri]